MHFIMCQLNIVTRIVEYTDYCNYFFIASIEITITLAVNSSQGIL
jgi:hypothetical protein